MKTKIETEAIKKAKFITTEFLNNDYKLKNKYIDRKDIVSKFTEQSLNTLVYNKIEDFEYKLAYKILQSNKDIRETIEDTLLNFYEDNPLNLDSNKLFNLTILELLDYTQNEIDEYLTQTNYFYNYNTLYSSTHKFYNSLHKKVIYYLYNNCIDTLQVKITENLKGKIIDTIIENFDINDNIDYGESLRVRFLVEHSGEIIVNNKMNEESFCY